MTVANSSKVHVEKLKYFLYQYVEYHSSKPSERIKTDNKRILKKEADGVVKKSEQKFDLVIDVPKDLSPSQDKSSSRLIHINYEVRVEAKIGTLHKSLVVQTPITIGTVAHEQQVTLRLAMGPQSPTSAVVPRVFTNVSLEILPHDQSNRSSLLTPQYPFSQLHSISSSPSFSVSPTYAIAQPYAVSPMSMVSNPSVGSQMNRFSYSAQSSYQMNPYQPTAPPISTPDFNSSVPDRPVSMFVPPSYDEACNGPQIGLGFNQINYATPQPLNNIPNKS